MAAWVAQPEALTGEALSRLRDAALGSLLLDRSTLAGSFKGSRGFAITFTADGLLRVKERFPEWTPFLDLALHEKATLRLRSMKARLLGKTPAPNAWYLNVLVLNENAAVGRHLDGTLRGPSGDVTATPLWVSVLYLTVPPREGGALRLWRKDRAVACIQPQPGLLLHFRGDLEHEVTALPPSGNLRLSVVLEQYHLAPRFLAAVPSFKIESRAGFAAFLEDRARRGMSNSEALRKTLEP
ncbi:MAG: 2OG-Fe(II) oxygenase [Myxococcaceae bacterium]|nr:2OG-Fe(II) oxygenase [Myxococcaceae bacterium]